MEDYRRGQIEPLGSIPIFLMRNVVKHKVCGVVYVYMYVYVYVLCLSKRINMIHMHVHIYTHERICTCGYMLCQPHTQERDLIISLVAAEEYKNKESLRIRCLNFVMRDQWVSEMRELVTFDSPDCEGFVRKQHKEFSRVWQKRYLKLDSKAQTLSYSDNKTSSVSGTILLTDLVGVNKAQPPQVQCVDVCSVLYIYIPTCVYLCCSFVSHTHILTYSYFSPTHHTHHLGPDSTHEETPVAL
jgi:hypothetical protein